MLLLLKHKVFFYLASVTLADFDYPLFGYHVWLSCVGSLVCLHPKFIKNYLAFQSFDFEHCRNVSCALN